jgi:DnaJ-class molecular chaperone
MTKLKNCPDCAAIEAFKQRIEKSGRKWIPSQKPCDRCNGSGKVKDHPSKPVKRRKDMSGEEWMEEDARWEREREYMERRE